MTASTVAVRNAPPQAGSLVLHQVRKDLAALRWVLLGWLALLAGEALLFVSFGPDLLALGIMLGLVVDIVMVAVVARVISEDPVAAGGDAFWRTLPLDRRTLLAARLILLGCCVLLPVLLAQSFCLWRLHVPSGRIPATLLGNLAWETCLVLAYAALAATVRGAARYAGVALLATIGTFLLIAVTTARFSVNVQSLSRQWPHPFLLLGLAGTVALSALLAFYLMRRPAAGARRPIAAAGVLFVFWVIAFGVISISDDARIRIEPQAETAAAWFRQPIVLERSSEGSRTNLEQNDPLFRAGTFRFAAPVDDVLLFPSRVKSQVDFGYGRVWAFDSGDRRWFSMDGPSPHDMALGLPGATNTQSVSRIIARVPPELGVDGTREKSGVLTAEVTFDGFHYARAGELALRDGAAVQVADTGLLVGGINVTESGALVVQVLATRLPGTVRHPDAPTPFAFALEPDGRRPPVRLERRTMSGAGRLVVLWPLPQQELYSLVLDAESVTRLGLRDPDAPEFAEARIIVSHATYVGSATRSFTVEDFDPRVW